MKMLESGETHLSHIAMVAGKITQANAGIIADFLPHKSKRQLQGFLSRVMPDGSLKDQEETIEFNVALPRSVYEKLERVIGLLKQGAKKDSIKVTAIDAACEAYLDKHDPIRKAERARKRKNSSNHNCPGAIVKNNPSKKFQKSISPGAVSRYIPAAVKHEVYQRDQSRCTFIGFAGKRCDEQSTLQLDHILMKCRGGQETVENLRLMCPEHNRYLAKINGISLKRQVKIP
jgi:hypothetical protein